MNIIRNISLFALALVFLASCEQKSGQRPLSELEIRAIVQDEIGKALGIGYKTSQDFDQVGDEPIGEPEYEVVEDESDVFGMFMSLVDEFGDDAEEATRTASRVIDDINDKVDNWSSGTQNTSNASDVDAWLDSYEKFVDHYLVVLEKSKKGDLSAITEYAKMQEDMESLTGDYDRISNGFTPAQLARYAKINKKITDAAMREL